MPIRETASSFLLGNYLKNTRQLRALILHRPTCHEHLATVCLNYLTNGNWMGVLMGMQDVDGSTRTNRVISQNRLRLFISEHPLLPYAVSHWAYHVSLAGPD